MEAMASKTYHLPTTTHFLALLGSLTVGGENQFIGSCEMRTGHLSMYTISHPMGVGEYRTRLITCFVNGENSRAKIQYSTENQVFGDFVLLPLAGDLAVLYSPQGKQGAVFFDRDRILGIWTFVAYWQGQDEFRAVRKDARAPDKAELVAYTREKGLVYRRVLSSDDVEGAHFESDGELVVPRMGLRLRPPIEPAAE